MQRLLLLVLLPCWVLNAAPISAQQLVKDIRPGEEGGSIRDYRLFGDQLLLMVSGGEVDSQLWVSDGTEVGTTLVSTIGPPNGLPPEFWYEAGDYFYFVAYEQSSGYELWRTDGTEEGTGLYSEFVEGQGSGVFQFGGELEGIAVFPAFNEQGEASELWRLENDSGNLNLIKVIAGGAQSRIGSFQRLGEALLFWANDGTSGRELWRTDGTAEGTYLVKDVVPGAADGSVSFGVWIGVVGNLALFRSPEDVGGELRPALWATDGSEEGTVRVFPANVMSPDATFVELGDGSYALFVGQTEAQGAEPWVSDGTAEGTRLLADIKEGSESSDLTPLPFLDGYQYFVATTFLRDIWRTDGVIVEPVFGGMNGVEFPGCTFDGGFFFGGIRVSDGTGFELWASDGTTSGTSLIADINEGPSSSRPGHFVCLESQAFFTADDGVHGRELWVIDESVIVDNEPEVLASAERFRLSPASPNPFRTQTSFTIDAIEFQQATVEAFDVLGRRVAVLYKGLLAPGQHHIELDGEGLANGVYVVRAVGEDAVVTRLVTRIE